MMVVHWLGVTGSTVVVMGASLVAAEMSRVGATVVMTGVGRPVLVVEHCDGGNRRRCGHGSPVVDVIGGSDLLRSGYVLVLDGEDGLLDGRLERIVVDEDALLVRTECVVGYQGVATEEVVFRPGGVELIAAWLRVAVD